jgi:hypothetical protein
VAKEKDPELIAIKIGWIAQTMGGIMPMRGLHHLAGSGNLLFVSTHMPSAKYREQKEARYRIATSCKH